MNSLLTSLRVLLPVAYAWAEKQELLILEKGEVLDVDCRAEARLAGVQHPEKIRLLPVDVLPQPEHDDVMFVAKGLGLFSPRSVGLSIGYGICLRHEVIGDRAVFLHECVHVSQYERLGSVREFLNVYLRECVEPGYPFGRLEQEAIHITRDICKQAEVIASSSASARF